MRTLSIDPGNIRHADIAAACEVLLEGGLVAFPTETVYGLGALGLEPAAVAKVFAAKQRPTTHPLILHVPSIAEAQGLTRGMPTWARALAEAFWPGPITMVLPKAACVPEQVTGGQDTVAVRAPNHPIALALLRAVGKPVAAPSANRYQAISPTEATHVARGLGAHVDLLLDGGPCSVGVESTVVAETSLGIEILRPGGIGQPEIEAILGRVHYQAGRVAEHGGASPGLDAKHYAPKAHVIATNHVARTQRRLAANGSQHVGVLTLGAPAPTADFSRALGDTPEAVAASLYRAFHDADLERLNTLIVELPPDTLSWAAVRDRMVRAASEFDE